MDNFHVLNPDARAGYVRHVLFDFDGTISTFRQGWESVMSALMAEVISGPTEPTPEMMEEIERYIDESTGILTIYQMRWLAESVRRWNLNPEPRTAREYKREYNERLLARIRHRLDAEGARERFTIPGARDFLAGWQARGARLYLASGTDHPYVVAEAEALGVANFFEGRIYGALDDREDHDKAAVIRDIFAEHGLRGEELLVVGDGPVEIREGKAAGALALGVACDEAALLAGQDGTLWHARKVERVKNAGADWVVPDFQEGQELITMLSAPEKDD